MHVNNTVFGHGVIPGGYGIISFASFGAVTVTDNSVSGCKVGLMAAASSSFLTVPPTPYTPPTQTISGNTFDAKHIADSTGVIVTTDEIGNGCESITARVVGNVIVHAANRFKTVVGDMFGLGDTGGAAEQAAPCSPCRHISIASSTITPAASVGTNGWIESGATIDASDNWWGCNSGPNSTGRDAVGAGVTASPWLVFHERFCIRGSRQRRFNDHGQHDPRLNGRRRDRLG